MSLDRRTFLAAAAASFACRPDAETTDPEPRDTALPPLQGCLATEGTYLRDLPFTGEPDRQLETTYGTGLDARRVLDLTTLGTDDLVLPQERLFLRTGAPTTLSDTSTWTIRLTGRVAADVDLDLDTLLAEATDQGVVHFECSGNTSFGGFGLQGAVSWRGVPMAQVLDRVQPDPDGTRIRITGLDDHPPPTGSSTVGASWVFRPDALQDAFLATHIDGQPLTPDHGAPVRLLIPGWYGCAAIKWVTELAWVGDDEPATSQMTEFAARTMQDGVPALARDYAPAEIDVAAIPIRVEVWELDGVQRIRVVGIVWGGSALHEGLRLWADDVDAGIVEGCARDTPRTWGLWHALLPEGLSGPTALTLTVDDPGVRTRRLDDRWYLRTVELS